MPTKNDPAAPQGAGPDSSSSHPDKSHAYDDKKGCLTMAILTLVTVVLTILAALFFNDFGK